MGGYTGRMLRAVVLIVGVGITHLSANSAPVRAADPAFAPLSPHDLKLYESIFSLQEEGRWSEADAAIARLDDRILLGHVVYQRLMHPTDYRASGKELQAWLTDYADHPGAEKIHALAERRAKGPVPDPELARLTTSRRLGSTGSGWGLEGKYGGGRAAAQKVWSRFRRALGRGQTLTVKDIVTSSAAGRLTAIDHDRMKGGLAYAYFVDGRDDWAVKWAQEAAARSGTRVPLAHWAAGLALWRQGDAEKALTHFEAVVQSPRVSPWLKAGGAYWAARSALRARQPEKVAGLLALAAAQPRTFYGMIATRALGHGLPFRWTPMGPGGAETRVMARPGGRRAAALMQIGRLDAAAEELRALYAKAPPALRKDILAVAADKGLPQVALRIARRDTAGAGDSALYPLSPWQPSRGWAVDPALVHAFIRQESAFNPDAVSHAGARGLMQLMPRTAAHVSGNHALRGHDRRQLNDPVRSLDLGQAYLQELLGLPQVKGNLFYLAAAYNSGPGRLQGWLQADRFQDDPLLFIESISSRETRIFIEHVISNFWAYRDRMGQPTPSLDAVAAGDWPRYMRSGGQLVSTAGNAE